MAVADAIESSRALAPVDSGFAEVDGVRIAYEVFGQGEETLLLLPPWSIIHSRHWKMQIPYLARHCRVLVYDGRGNGRSDRPESGYDEREFAADAVAVMDATGTASAHVVSLSLGAQRALILADEHPERVESLAFIAPAVALGSRPIQREVEAWHQQLVAHLRPARGRHAGR